MSYKLLQNKNITGSFAYGDVDAVSSKADSKNPEGWNSK